MYPKSTSVAENEVIEKSRQSTETHDTFVIYLMILKIFKSIYYKPAQSS